MAAARRQQFRNFLHGPRVLAGSAGFGNGGQRLFVVPDLDVAIVITAGAYDDPAIAGTVRQLFEQIIAAVQD